MLNTTADPLQEQANSLAADGMARVSTVLLIASVAAYAVAALLAIAAAQPVAVIWGALLGTVALVVSFLPRWLQI